VKLTKYGHACFTVEIDGQVLVVDPGNLSTDFQASDNTVAIIVTHAHPDHFDPDVLASIYNRNPESLLLSTAEVTEKMVDHRSQKVSLNSEVQVGPFRLKFLGGTHATIHESVPAIDNVGVIINETLYYPGDSFVNPDQPIKALALPLGAPWLKTANAIDFMVAVKPEVVFPTHDAVLSDAGKKINDSWIERFAEPLGIRYQRLGGEQSELLL